MRWNRKGRTIRKVAVLGLSLIHICSLGQIARGYGYITSTRRERRIMLLVLDAALTGGMEYPALSDQLDQALSGTELTGLSEQELADRVAGKLAEELLAAKFLQGIPLAGAVGGVLDLSLIHIYW